MGNLDTFREDTRQWIKDNYPESLKAPMGAEDYISGGSKQVFANPDSKVWLDRMYEKGWTCPTWPKDCGGAGLNREENKVLQEELGRAKCRPAIGSMGIAMLGPTLLMHGSEELKREHLPKIASGEVAWCQGYSEPGAGSDLAGLSMRADDMGDHYVVNGSKIWTSGANMADWMFSLVRTDFAAKKHDGISVILYDMKTEGVQISPIVLISGYSTFYETNLDNVKVPKANLVGEENQGWTIAKYLLTHERTMISGTGQRMREWSLAERAKQYQGEENGRVADPILRDDIAKQEMDDHAFGLMTRRSAEAAKAGEGPGAKSSMFKHIGTKFAKQKVDLQMSIAGAQGLGWEGEGFSEGELTMTRDWLRSRGYSIEGGTSEIMLNIVSKRILGLPV